MVTYAAILIVLAAVLYVLEIFIPSGGILGFLATVSLIAGLVCIFWVNTVAGVIATLITLMIAPFALALALKVVPNTPIGKSLALSHRQSAGTIHYDRNLAGREDELVGAVGVAVSELRPVGTCVIDGKRIECLAETGLIEPGVRVRVASVRGMEVKVRQV